MLADPDCDGDADLAIAGFGTGPRLLRNDISLGRSGLSLRLRGSTSNPIGLGAVVWVEVDGLPTRKMVVGAVGNPQSVSEPMVFAGLGEVGVAREVRVVWPSGTEQVLRDVAGGRCLTLDEPPVLRVEPSLREAPADGTSTVTVWVTPRDPAGALRTDARVEARLDGEGRIEGVEPTAEGWRVVLRAPTRPSEGVVRVWVDGEAVGVRPRVTWR